VGLLGRVTLLGRCGIAELLIGCWTWDSAVRRPRDGGGLCSVGAVLPCLTAGFLWLCAGSMLLTNPLLAMRAATALRRFMLSGKRSK
jgi:hypothetical protein